MTSVGVGAANSTQRTGRIKVRCRNHHELQASIGKGWGDFLRLKLGRHGDSSAGYLCMTPLSLSLFIESLCHSRTRMGQKKTASRRHTSQCQLNLLHSFVIIGGNGGEHTGCFYKEPYSTNMHLCSQRDSLVHWHPSEERLVLGPELVQSSSGNRMNTPLAGGVPWRGIHPHLKRNSTLHSIIPFFQTLPAW